VFQINFRAGQFSLFCVLQQVGTRVSVYGLRDHHAAASRSNPSVRGEAQPGQIYVASWPSSWNRMRTLWPRIPRTCGWCTFS